MYNIARLRNLIDSTRQALAEQEVNLLQKQDSFYRQMLVESSRAQLDELIRQLVEEESKRDVEVIEIRLVGEKAHYGSLPMHILSELTSSFEEVLVQAGRYRLYGADGTHPASQYSLQEIRNLMDVRLKRVASGSTRLFVTAKTSPDLFGNSLSEDCLNNTFSLLNTERLSDLNDDVASLGRQSVHNLSRFLKTLTEAQLQAHVHWQTPLDTTITWDGTLDRIGVLQHTLASVSQHEPQEIGFEGEILMESIRGRGKFEVKDHRTGRVYKGSAPKPVLPSLLALHVGEGCKGVLLETTVENKISGTRKSIYELKLIEPLQLPPRQLVGTQLPILF